MPQQPVHRKRGLLFLLLFSLLWFGTLDYRKLVKPDEGRYAEIPREMAATGDWITPRLNGIKYFEKPPLQYWATAAAFDVFGLNEWTARLWTALTGFLTIGVVWWTGRRLFGDAAGWYAAVVLASNVYFVLMGHVNTLDMGLTFFTTLAVAGFAIAQRTQAGEVGRSRAMLLVWAAMALAVLSKGLIGVVLPGATLVIYALLTRDWTLWGRLNLLPGLALFLAIAAPWFIAVSLKNPEFAWFFFIHEHFLRYATPTARREGPIYYFLPILLIGCLPWTIVMLDGLWTAVRGRHVPADANQPAKGKPAPDNPTLVLLIWTLLVFAFFSVSSSKLPAYILPIFPTLALLTGKRLAALEGRRLWPMIIANALLAIIGFFAIAYAVEKAGDPVNRPLYHAYSYWLYTATALLLAGTAYACFASWRGRKAAAIHALAATGLLTSLIAGNGHNTFAPVQSSYDLAQQIRPYVKDNVPFYSVQTYDQTLPFYLRRTLTLVNFSDEMSYGLEQEPRLALDMNGFARHWATEPNALALMQPGTYDTLRDAGYSMEVIANDGKRIVVRKPAGKNQ